MSQGTERTFAGIIAARVQSDALVLAQRWFDRLSALLPVASNEIFPSDDLLDHIPGVIEQIGVFIGAPENEISANTFVIRKAQELGELRDAQHASVHQLLREYEVLRGILETFASEQASRLHLTPDCPEVMTCVRRINQAVALLTQTTIDTFVKRYATTIADQTHQLEGFNRMISHELRQPLAALQMAARLLLSADGSDESRRNRLTAAVTRNVARLVDLTTNIIKISRMSVARDAPPSTQRTSLVTVVREAARQLRDMAKERGVAITIAPDLPDVVVDVGQLELLVLNLLSNAIKYCDPSKDHRSVDVVAVTSSDSDCVFEIRDNGLGMDDQQLKRVFTPFYRGHADRDHELGVEGLGLGLTIVRDCAKAIGATVDIESIPGNGTAFKISLPCHPVAG